ncbi:MAG: TonB-dependent receptor, partial [Pirellulales bacterium]|nr:TonB-dependent receptor [Pirellulales bacterium]
PQGTLFGRNTIGGALNITSRKPADELSGTAELTVGSESRVDFRGSIDIPFSETFRTSFAMSSKTRDGFVDRVLVGDALGDEDRYSLRLLAVFEPSDSLDFEFSYDLTRIDEASAGTVMVGITGNSPNAPATATDGYALFLQQQMLVGVPGFPDYTEANFLNPGEAGSDQTFATGLSGTDLDIDGASFTINWHAQSFDFKSITAVRNTDGSFSRDADNSPITHLSPVSGITETINPEYDHEQFTQELQITGSAFDDRLNYVAGLYYFDEEGTDNVFVPVFTIVPFDLGGAMPFLAGAPVVINNFAQVDNTSEALYMQGDFAVTESLGFTIGIRRTEDEKEFKYTQYVASSVDGDPLPPPPPGAMGPPPMAVDENGVLRPGIVPLVGNGSGTDFAEFSQTTVKAGIDYQFANDSLLYLSYSEGFKSGGFVLRYVQPQPNALSFSPEEAQSFELGYKWQGLENRLRINAAAFTTNYDNAQVMFFDAGGGPVTQNAGEITIDGLEVELSALLGESFQLDASIGLIDASYDAINPPSVPLALTIDTSAKLVNTPETTASLGLQYDLTTGSGSTWAFHADWSYSDDVFNDAQNSPFLFQSAYSLVNVSIGFSNSEDTWDLVVFGENVTDERYIISGDSNFGLGFHEANFNRPAEYGVTFRYRFD